MIEWVLREYFSIFSWQSIKGSKKGSWWHIFYFMFLVPLMLQTYKEEGMLLMYYMVMIPIVFCIWMESRHSTLLPKVMYLCPLNQEMRKQYVKYTYYTWICVPILLGILGVVVLLCLGICDVIAAIIILFNITTISICAGGCRYVNGKSSISETGTLASNSGLLESFILMVGMLTGLFAVLFVQEIWAIPWFKWGFLIAEVVVQGLMMRAFLKKWKAVSKQLLTYEKNEIVIEEPKNR